MALEVEEDVALVGLWKQGKAALRLLWQEVPDVPAGATPLQLQRRLVA